MDEKITENINKIPFDMTNILIEIEKYIPALLTDREAIFIN